MCVCSYLTYVCNAIQCTDAYIYILCMYIYALMCVMSVKGKDCPCHTKQVLTKCRYIVLPILNFGTRRGGRSSPRPGRFIRGKKPDAVDQKGLGSGRDISGKSHTHKISIPRPPRPQRVAMSTQLSRSGSLGDACNLHNVIYTNMYIYKCVCVCLRMYVDMQVSFRLLTAEITILLR